MPAISLPRLRKQCALLEDAFEDTSTFNRELHQILDTYASHTYRSGQAGKPPPLIASYNVPRQVIRHIILQLTSLIQANPNQALQLANALWNDAFYETRLLAALFLGQLPASYFSQVIEKLRFWLEPGCDEQLINDCISEGLHKVRLEQPEFLLEATQTWLNSKTAFEQSLGLRSLLVLLKDAESIMYPTFFRLLTPYVRQSALEIQPLVRDILILLTKKSPAETAYFLHNNLKIQQNALTAKFTRQCLPFFTEEARESLRIGLRKSKQD